MINENEQWQLEGKCDLCRRKNYCKKDCTKKKKRIEKEINSIIMDKLFAKYRRLF